MRRCLLIVIISLCMICLASVSLAEPLIPDRCFVDGDLDCERPQCYDICFTPPTPGYERPPATLSSRQRPDDIEAERILAGPRLKVPFKEDDTPAKPVQIKDDKPVPQNLASSCDPLNSEEMFFILRQKAAAKRWINVANDRIKHHVFDEIDNYQLLHNHEDLYDLFTYNQLVASCYRIENQCIKGGDQAIKLQRHEAYMTYVSICTNRDRYYKSLLDCIRHPECNQHNFTYSLECLSSECRSDYEMNILKKNIKKYQEKFAKQVEELKKLQCTK